MARSGRGCVRTVEPRTGPNWDEDTGAGEYPNSYYFYLPRMCNHCTNPACVAACPRKAIYKREEDGIVLVDQSRCRGYQHCVAACPYKKMYFNPTVQALGEMHLLLPAHRAGPAAGLRASSASGASASSATSTTRRAPVHKLVEKWKVALPLHAEFGTQPNVYYVPPLSPPKYDAEGRLTNERAHPGGVSG